MSLNAFWLKGFDIFHINPNFSCIEGFATSVYFKILLTNSLGNATIYSSSFAFNNKKNLSFHEVLSQVFFIQMWYLSFLHNIFLIGIHASLEAHHAKIMALVAGAKTSTLFFCIAKKFLVDHMDSLWWTTMVMFLGWILGNCVFCLNEVVEPLLTRAIRIACFIANFVMLLGLFASDNDCTTHESNFICISASFVNPVGLEWHLSRWDHPTPFASQAPLWECLEMQPRSFQSIEVWHLSTF